MSIETKAKQKSPEWRILRAGRITASRISAVLGVSPFTSQRALMKEMVTEAIDGPVEKRGPQLAWGNDNEDKARSIYEFLYLNDTGEQRVYETGFWTDEWEEVPVGASPDGLIGDDGMVEMKCPYSLRNEKSPHFKSISEMPHYMHQVQMQLHIMGRKWCDFFQWAPNGHRCERVNIDPLWREKVIDSMRDFYTAYQLMMESTSSGGPQEKVAHSARWYAAAEGYLLAKREKEAAEEEMDAHKVVLLDLCEAAVIDECQGAGINLSKILTSGRVDYKGMLEALVPPNVIAARLEEFRGKPSSSWRLTEVKEK